MMDSGALLGGSVATFTDGADEDADGDADGDDDDFNVSHDGMRHASVK